MKRFMWFVLFLNISIPIDTSIKSRNESLHSLKRELLCEFTLRVSLSPTSAMKRERPETSVGPIPNWNPESLAYFRWNRQSSRDHYSVSKKWTELNRKLSRLNFFRETTRKRRFKNRQIAHFGKWNRTHRYPAMNSLVVSRVVVVLFVLVVSWLRRKINWMRITRSFSSGNCDS